MAEDPREAEWRAKAARRELTLEDMKEIVVLLRQGRESAKPKEKAPRKSTKKAKEAE